MNNERPLTARMVQKRDDSTITLNVYDVVDHPFHYAVGKMLSCGIHHSGIQVDEREFAFTLEGIVVTEPHKIPRCALTHQILLTRSASDSQVRDALSVLQRRFTAHNYDPLTNNCNHFSDAFCELLNVRKARAGSTRPFSRGGRWNNQTETAARDGAVRRVVACFGGGVSRQDVAVLLTRINDDAPAVTSAAPRRRPRTTIGVGARTSRAPSPRSFSSLPRHPVVSHAAGRRLLARGVDDHRPWRYRRPCVHHDLGGDPQDDRAEPSAPATNTRAACGPSLALRQVVPARRGHDMGPFWAGLAAYHFLPFL